MANYHYHIDNDKLKTYKGEINEIGKDFRFYEHSSFGEGNLYYKTENKKITEIIFETTDSIIYANEKVDEFIENLEL